MTATPPSDPDIDAGTARDRRPATPRWVKLLGIAGLIAVLVVVVVMVVAGGQHGPMRHVPAPPTPGAGTPPASVIQETVPWRAGRTA